MPVFIYGEEYLTTSEAAILAGRSVETIRRWILIGLIEALRDSSGRWLIRGETLTSYLRVELRPGLPPRPHEEADYLGQPPRLDPRLMAVQDAVRTFRSHARLTFSMAAIQYLVLETMVEPNEFLDGLRESRFRLVDLNTQLTEVLEQAQEEANSEQVRSVARRHVQLASFRVIDGRFGCPYPFIIC